MHHRHKHNNSAAAKKYSHIFSAQHIIDRIPCIYLEIDIAYIETSFKEIIYTSIINRYEIIEKPK
jgi:hypothetical protein